ncbi:DNA alkylation repair enzyme [Candidatus Magnetoovum chiemensis]|nr:DNA alkylation repair enzyme [Candidatus Magnetoovum chiemensis]
MEDNPENQIALFREIFTANYNKERAVKEKSYLKSPFEFYGVSVPFTDKMAKEFKKKNPAISKDYLIELADTLWNSNNHNEKTLAIKILSQYPEHLDIALMPYLESLLHSSTGWDHIDEISIHLVGDILAKQDSAFEYLERWSVCESFWLRRASLISQILLFRHSKGKPELFFGFARKMITEKEFFIRKAIGWTLREMSKANPDAVFDFLMEVREKASKLTLREGSKRLPDDKRALIVSKKQ